MLKRVFFLLLVTALFATGCSLKKKATIVVMAPQDQVWDAERTLADNFTKETGIKVDFQIFPSDQWANLLQTKLNSGECGDIFMDQSGALNIGPRYNIEKNGVDLSRETWVKTIDPNLLTAVTLNGKVYGLELWDVYNAWTYVYSKPIFKKLGLSVPKTYAEFKAVCDKIKAAGITPIYESGADGWHHQLPLMELGMRLNQLHPGLYDQLNANEIKLADVPEAQKLLEQILEISRNYYGDNFLSDQYANTGAIMATGKAAICLRGPGFPTEIVSEAKDYGAKTEDYGVFVMPFLDNQTLNINPQGPTHFVYAQGKNIEEAKAYLSYLAKKENAQYFLDNVPRFNKLPVMGLEYKQSDAVKEIEAAVKESGIVMQAGVKYIDPQWMDIGKDMTAMFTGQITPKEVLENMDKRRTDQAIAQKDPAWVK